LEDRRLLAVFAVNSFLDTVDATPGDGVAADAQGHATLRAAIMEANATSAADTINLPAGTYTLTRTGSEENGCVTGDLDITNDLTILGAGTSSTIINATGLGDRVFHLLSGTYTDYIDVRWQDITIMGGTASGGSSWQQDRGGAIYSDYDTSVTISNCVLKHNAAPRTTSGSSYGIGGAICSDAVLEILNSRFEENSASNCGGAIYVGASTAITAIRNSTFSNNSAWGGGAIENGYTMTIENSTFSGNRGLNSAGTQGNGGAINNSGSLTLTNCTISGNQSTFGGGILNYGELTAINGTITGNTASYGGGVDASSGSCTVENTIIAGNEATSGPEVYGTVTSIGHNLVGNAANATGFVADGDLVNTNPMLAPLADNGGPTLTHALLPGSPAFNAANTIHAPSTDQRGISRPQGSVADIGAFEAVATLNDPVKVTIDPTSISEAGGTATGVVTRGWVTSAPLVIDLTSSDTTEAIVPATVTIPANQASTSFSISAADDVLIDGRQTVTITAAVHDSPVGLDPSFGIQGLASTTLKMNIQPPNNAIAVQPDGKIVAAAEADTDTYAWRITRLNSNGSVDTSFGANGTIDTDFSVQYPVPYKVVVQSDGKILVGGKLCSGTGAIALARYNANGSLDSSFGTNGIASFPTISNQWISDMVQRSDGKILLALDINGTVYFRVACVNSDGTLYAGFGSNGVATYSTVSTAPAAMTLMSDGRFLVAGNFTGVSKVIRANPNGSLDTTFGTNGVQSVSFGPTYTTIHSVAVDSAGRVVLGACVSGSGNNTADFAVARLNSDGTFDTTFGGTGKVITDVAGSLDDVAYTMVVQSDNKIVLTGYAETSDNVDQVAIVRYGIDGSLDTTFDNDGILRRSITSKTAQRVLSSALQANGRLVVLAGWGSDWRVARFNMGVPPPPATGTLTVTDNDVAGITINPPSPAYLITTEAGGSASATIVLNSQPTANVTIALSSSNTTEGTVSPPSLTFTPSNWNIPQTIAVTGVDDSSLDGNVSYAIVTDTAASSDPNYSGLNPPDIAVVNKDNEVTGIAIASDHPAGSLCGQTVVFTATLKATPAGSPTGNITFKNGSSVLGNVALNTEGQAVLSVSTFTPGNHTITASYDGDATFATSGILLQTVCKKATQTVMTVSGSTSTVEFTVRVDTVVPDTGVPTGQVTLKAGSTILGKRTLNTSGKAIFNVAASKVNGEKITASYTGSSGFANSTASMTKTAQRAVTKMVLDVSACPSLVGQPVTFTASVKAGSHIPTGRVTFEDGTDVLGIVKLDSTGTAKFSISTLKAGNHKITASYAGNSTLCACSGSLTEVINKVPTSTVVTVGPNPGKLGQGVTFTVTVSAAVAGRGMPSGAVTLSDGGSVLATQTLDANGVATFNISTLSVGDHAISISYVGTVKFGASSTSLTEKVAAALMVDAKSELLAIDARAVDRIDLLTVVEHELGHIAGLKDLDALTDDLMSGVLGAGARRVA
jgi:uncharacterized delta-60 repeat protein